MPLGMEVGVGPGDIVLDGDPVRPHKKWHSPSQFSAHVYWVQTAVCIRIPLVTGVGLSLGDIVFDADPPPLPKKGTEPSNFRPLFLLWPNGWMDQDATWYRAYIENSDFTRSDIKGTELPPANILI